MGGDGLNHLRSTLLNPIGGLQQLRTHFVDPSIGKGVDGFEHLRTNFVDPSIGKSVDGFQHLRTNFVDPSIGKGVDGFQHLRSELRPWHYTHVSGRGKCMVPGEGDNL